MAKKFRDDSEYFGFGRKQKPKPDEGYRVADPGSEALGINRRDWDRAAQPKAKRFKEIPPGVWDVLISRAWTRENFAGQKILIVRWEIFDGPNKGASLLENFTIFHPKEAAREFALQKLAAVCQAAGIGRMPDKVGDLLGAVCRIEVVPPPKDRNRGKLSNSISRHSPAPEV